MRKTTRVALSLAGVLIVVIAAILTALTFPRTPDGGRSLRFRGFVVLSGKGALQVLDYLSVYQRQLFVTGVSTGDVYRIPLRVRTLPNAADVSVFNRMSDAHGVAVDPVSGLAFVTRSGAN